MRHVRPPTLKWAPTLDGMLDQVLAVAEEPPPPDAVFASGDVTVTVTARFSNTRGVCNCDIVELSPSEDAYLAIALGPDGEEVARESAPDAEDACWSLALLHGIFGRNDRARESFLAEVSSFYDAPSEAA